MSEESKAFFFAKKKQKTFVSRCCQRSGLPGNARMFQMRGARVFWSFFAKKDCFLALLACGLLLTACAEDTPAPQNFASLQYGYLSKLRLNVGTIQIQDRSLPVSPQDIASSSPVIPAQALQQMAHDRLFAAGTQGQANFVIDQASIIRGEGGGLSGRLAVHLDLVADTGARSGFAEAQVSRQYVPGSDPETGAAAVYNLTRQMMDAMNVELEFQIRRSLGAWLVTPGSAPAPVVAQPLGVPGAPPPVPAPPPLPPAAPQDQAVTPVPPAPDQDGYVDPAAPPPPQQMSPQPGYLHVPEPSLPPAQ